MTEYAMSKTDEVGELWRSLDQNAKLLRIRAAIEGTKFSETVSFTRAIDNGAVYVTMNQPLGPQNRGTTLLDLEEFLKSTVDKGIHIWVEPIGDRNSLRNLRGVQILS